MSPNSKTGPSISALSVQMHGEKTSLPISVTKVVARATAPLPFVDKSHVSLELHMVNKAVNKKDVAAKLQLSLPVGATVKKFELRRSNLVGDKQWYPATAVPKKKAKTVVYKEKEKGREVAAASNAAAATNQFEMEISPLPYKKTTLCRLEILTVGSPQELLDSLKQNDETEMVVEMVSHDLPHFQQTSSGASTTTTGGSMVGEAFGKNHFVCKIPSITMADPTTRNKLDHIAIVWDASASTNSTKSIDKCCSRLKELLNTANTQTVDVCTLGVGDPRKLGSYEGNDVERVERVIKNIKHDGGTDLTTLPPLASELTKDNTMDAVLVFSDGVDSLGRTPVFDNSNDILFPAHCVAPNSDIYTTINVRNLKTIAAASPNMAGTVLATKRNDSYLQGIVFPQPVLHSIVVDQDEEAFLEEVDDGFLCTRVPDHRLRVLNQPIPNDGLLIAGVLGDSSSVTKLTAHVQVGPNDDRTFHFKLRESSDTDNATQEEGCASCPTLFLKPKEEAKKHNILGTLFGSKKDTTDPAARVLGHIYAEELYQQAESFGIRSGLSTEQVREDLAVSYGFCSPESSLLMLYDKEQFIEHGISPPEGHPAAKDMPPPKTNDSSNSKTYGSGEIGGLKNDQQREQVVHLAHKLAQFLTEKPPCPPTGARGRALFGKKTPKWHSCVVVKDNQDGTMKVKWDDGTVTSRLPTQKFQQTHSQSQSQTRSQMYFGEVEECCEEECCSRGGSLL